MQVLAILVVLLFCAAVLGLSALVGLVFGGITATVVKDVSWPRRLARSATCALPFVCLALVTLPFLLQRLIVEKTNVPGSCRLSNGFSLMMVDTTGPALVYKSTKDFTKAGIDWQKEGVDGVTVLQVADRYVLGGRNSYGWAHSAEKEEEVESYFLLDTKTGKITTVPSIAELEKRASQLGVHLNLEHAYRVYLTQSELVRVPRFGPPLVSAVLLCLLVRWILQVHRFRSANLMNTATSA